MGLKSGGEIIVDSLIANKVNVVFGIPGIYNLSIYDAIHKSSKINHILATHEGNAALMADGYARVSGKPGICLTIAGPGATNALTGLITAYAESSPVLLIATEINLELMGKDKGVSHEIKNQFEIFNSTLSLSKRTKNILSIPFHLNSLFNRMQNGRKRPTYFEIPWDLLSQKKDIKRIRYVKNKKKYGVVIKNNVINLIQNSRSPLIFSGLGSLRSNASTEILNLSKKIGAPVITSPNGKGIIPEDNISSLGAGLGRNPAHQEILNKSDLILAIGTSFDIWTMKNWDIEIPGKILRIDICKKQLNKNYKSYFNIHGDAKLVTAEILKRIKQKKINKSWISKSFNLTREERSKIEDGNYIGAKILKQFKDSLPRNVLITSDTTMFLQWLLWNFDVYEKNSILLPWNSGTLGFAIPAAIGAKIANPEKFVIAFVGDGGFMFTSQELATAARYKVPIVIVLFNNKSHGSIKQSQIKQFNNRTIGVDLTGIDYVSYSKSLGVSAKKITRISSISNNIKKLLNTNKPQLLEIKTSLNGLNHPWVST